MSEFERTPESMRAELEAINKSIEQLNEEYSSITDGELIGDNLEKASQIMEKAKKLKKETYRILIAINDITAIHDKLHEEAELYLEMGMEPDYNALLFETYGLDETYELETDIQSLIKKMQSDLETE